MTPEVHYTSGRFALNRTPGNNTVHTARYLLYHEHKNPPVLSYLISDDTPLKKKKAVFEMCLLPYKKMFFLFVHNHTKRAGVLCTCAPKYAGSLISTPPLPPGGGKWC